ncbi:hypothetical protein [Actinocrinis sp.]|uniref:hypothetical protein n=1 Tax=Actinocrinis sp. TaxID=1920516 RepID=UPI002D531FFE|nr:hypothetical protein [Actinocrinis sp.]HZP52743.1 hypothetical protein [Actinocrinis sp.]
MATSAISSAATNRGHRRTSSPLLRSVANTGAPVEKGVQTGPVAQGVLSLGQQPGDLV